MGERRPRLPGIGVAAVLLGFFGAASTGRAQVAFTTPRPTSTGFTVSLTPYAWLPTVSSIYSYNGPRGTSVTNTVNTGIGDYISKLNFATMIGGEARYDRFSIMTDLVYANASLTTSNSYV